MTPEFDWEEARNVMRECVTSKSISHASRFTHQSSHHADSCFLSCWHGVRSTTQPKVSLAAHKAKFFLAQDLFEVVVSIGITPCGGANGHNGIQAICHFSHLAQNSRHVANRSFELHNRRKNFFAQGCPHGDRRCWCSPSNW